MSALQTDAPGLVIVILGPRGSGGGGGQSLGSLRSELCQEGLVTPPPKNSAPHKAVLQSGIYGMACWVCVRESTSSCHKSYALALVCREGGLMKGLRGGRPPISARLEPAPALPSLRLGARSHRLGSRVGWRVGWELEGGRSRGRLLKQERRATRCGGMGTGCSPPTRDPEEVTVTVAGGIEGRCKDGLSDGDSGAGGRGGGHSGEWTSLSAGDNRGIEPDRVLGVTGQTEW